MKKTIVVIILLVCISSVSYAQRIDSGLKLFDCPLSFSESDVYYYFSLAGTKHGKTFDENLKYYFSRGYEAKYKMILYGKVPTRKKGREIFNRLQKMLYPKEYVYNANCPPIKYIQQEIQINFEDKSTFLMDARFYDENFRTLERVQVYEASSDSILFNNIKKAFDRVYVKVRAKQIGEEW